MFSPDTLIKNTNDECIKIDNINVGDILEDNNVVLSKISYNNPFNLYKIDEIIVSGDHLVYDSGLWKRVADIDRSIKIRDNIIDKLVCLVTSKGVIKVNDLIFKDYLDTHNKNTNAVIRNLVEMSLNSNCVYKKFGKCDDLIYGFHPHNIILNRDEIIGKVIILKNSLNVYKLKNKILSGNILVYYKMSWRR